MSKKHRTSLRHPCRDLCCLEEIAYQADRLSDAGQDEEHPSAQSVDDHRRHRRRQHLYCTDNNRCFLRWDGTVSANEDVLHVKQHKVDTGQLLKRSQGTGINQGFAISLHFEQVGDTGFIPECFLDYNLEKNEIYLV